jgi:hypothetical protein
MSIQPENSAEISIYIGCTEAQALVAKVLAWSILSHTERQTRFYYLYRRAIDFEMPRNPANRPGTPFSFQRFMVPELAGYTGRAIYMDSDQIVCKNVAKLFDYPLHGAPLSCCDTKRGHKLKPMHRSSVMLLDCAQLDWQIQRIVADLDARRYSYRALLSLEGHRPTLPRAWNSLDRYHWPFTALLHYTAKRRQPWIQHNHKLAYLWFDILFSAVDAGFIAAQEVAEAARQALIRPSVGYQLEHRLADPRKLPAEIKAGDAAFIDACAAREFNTVPGEYRQSLSS